MLDLVNWLEDSVLFTNLYYFVTEKSEDILKSQEEEINLWKVIKIMFSFVSAHSCVYEMKEIDGAAYCL